MSNVKKINITCIMTSTGLRHYLGYRILAKIGVLVVAALAAQSGQAAGEVCPIVKSAAQPDVVRMNNSVDSNGNTIYFCKQNFTQDQLTYTPSQTDLVAGGSQHQAMGNTIQSFPMSNSINLIGFTPKQLNLNRLSSNVPTSANASPSYAGQNLFNFYTRVNLANPSLCKSFGGVNQYDRIRAYLRSNPNIFRANGGTQPAVTASAGDDIAIIQNVVVGHTTQNNSPIIADITFYHTNYSAGGQFFSTGRTASDLQFCWVGVSTRMDIKTDTNEPKYSGTYKVDVGVLTP